MTVIYHHHGSPRVAPGDVVVIKTNGVVTGGMGVISLTHQWHLDGRAISGEVNPQYKVRDSDLGHTITCIQTATDGSNRELQLKTSNQILVGKAKRGARPDKECPPGTVKHPPERRKPQVVAAVSRVKPAPSGARPTREQLKAEVKKAKGGCKSCAERAKARSRRNNP
jgi:hypothetical protein